MAASEISRPRADEHAPYYERYVSLVPEMEILSVLEQQVQRTTNLLSRNKSSGDLRYAPGKWSLKEVIGHLSDTERILGYRALRIGRGDTTPIEGFEQDDYVQNANFSQRTLPELAEEFATVRQSTAAFFRSLAGPAWVRRGVANGNEVSVRALAYIIAGHEIHHRKILEENYLGTSQR